MPHRHPRLIHVWNFNPGAERAYYLLGALCVAESVAMLLSGPGRFSGGHWAPVYTLGGPVVFGVLFGLVGVAILLAPLRRPAWAWWALFAGAAIHFFLAIVFGTAAGKPTASVLGPIIYAWVGLHFMSHRDVYRAHRKVRGL